MKQMFGREAAALAAATAAARRSGCSMIAAAIAGAVQPSRWSCLSLWTAGAYLDPIGSNHGECLFIFITPFAY
jgi:hypothetical protein